VIEGILIIRALAVWHDGFETKLNCFFTIGLLCHSVVIPGPTFSFVASRNAISNLVTNDRNNRLYSTSQDSCQIQGSLNANQDRLSLHGSSSANHDCCSVHGFSNANQATLFSPRIFQCK